MSEVGMRRPPLYALCRQRLDTTTNRTFERVVFLLIQIALQIAMPLWRGHRTTAKPF